MQRYVELWRWLNQVNWDAQQQGNQTISQTFTRFNEGWQCREFDPQRTLAAWQHAQQLAEQGGNACLALYYQYWCCEAQVFYLGDLPAGYAAAVRMLIEARKPQYAHCPALGRVYRMVTDTYLFLDAVGHADKIREMIAHVEKNVPIDDDSHCLLMHRQSLLAYELDDLDTAYTWALAYLELGEANDFQGSYAHSWLAYLCYRRGELAAALQHARTSEKYARRISRYLSLINALSWQALLVWQQGDTTEAERLYNAAVMHTARRDRRPGGFFEAAREYHKRRGDLPQALHWQETLIKEVQNAGEIYWECKARLKAACLMGQMGTATADLAAYLAQVRHLTTQLLAPQALLAKLEQIAGGNYDESAV
jgi:tetratricopeptide (TPR) repeat protein